MEIISAVIPSYNHSEYIEACLDSIYFQDYPEIEMIIIDDNSTDDSVETINRWIRNIECEEVSHAFYYNESTNIIERAIYKRYGKKRSIYFFANSENLGSTKNYNRGFARATGEFCTFIASDDIAHPQLFSTLVQPLRENRADFVYANMFIIDDRQRVLREFVLPDYSFEACFCNWYLCGVATLYRRSLHKEFGLYDETAMADDHECYLRFAMNGTRFLHVPKTLYSVRSHEARRVGLHSQDRFQKLLKHSKDLCIMARKYAKMQKNQQLSCKE